MANNVKVTWQSIEVSSPIVEASVSVIAAKNIAYIPNGNRFQTLHVYLPKTSATSNLVGSPAIALPATSQSSNLPRWHIHIHGGAWRDPFLTAESIEAAIACAFSSYPSDGNGPIDAIISLNYTLSPYPTHPTAPYNPTLTGGNDTEEPEREATHPMHVRDVLTGFKMLRDFGLRDGEYILTGHSCGACLAFQSTLQSPKHYGIHDLPEPPRPAALIGLNGLYDLPALVHGLGPSHASMRDDYRRFLSIAFGADQLHWPAASPAYFDADEIASRVKNGVSPKLVLLDQSREDQLVPYNELERMKIQLEQVGGLQVVLGKRCVGKHAEPWEKGDMIWRSVLNVLEVLESGS